MFIFLFLSYLCSKCPVGTSVSGKYFGLPPHSPSSGDFYMFERIWCRVETSINDHLRDFASIMEKYKVVQNFPVEEDRNHDDYKFF